VPPSKTRPVDTAGPGPTRDALAGLRPDLLGAYDEALPGARAAILSRLLGAVDREPLTGLTAHVPDRATHPREPAGPAGRREDDRSTEPAGAERKPAGADHLVAFLADGRTLVAPVSATKAFAVPTAGLAAHLDGVAHTDPGTLLRALALPGHTDRLARELDNSVANLALARAARALAPPPAALHEAAGDPDGLGRLEQQVVDGHPLHPCARTRGGMTVADVLAYAPEHGPVIRLQRLRVPTGRWYGDSEPVLFAHPWQADRLRDNYPWLADDGETGPVRPLMSLRTVAPLDGSAHVKTAVDVQMTSAVRTVSPAAVHNGPVLSGLLRELTRDLPLDVLAETAAGAVLVDGEPQRHLAYLRREAPRLGATEVAIPLAALGTVLDDVVDDPYAWVESLAALLVPALLTVLERGVALEAHGQNTLLVLDGTTPRRILYRDLGGVRVSARRLRKNGFEVPDLRGDLPTDEPDVLRTKLAAAAFGTVAAELVALLERRRGADPGRLWQIFATHTESTEDGRQLMREPLPVKATTAMRLADDPLDDIWAPMVNPMAAFA
jgi:hypothetical protein